MTYPPPTGQPGAPGPWTGPHSEQPPPPGQWPPAPPYPADASWGAPPAPGYPPAPAYPPAPGYPPASGYPPAQGQNPPPGHPPAPGFPPPGDLWGPPQPGHPGHPPVGAPPGQAPSGPGGHRAEGPPKRGAGRIVLGVLVAGFGVLAVLGGGGVIAQAYGNSRQMIPNQQYLTNLWRNVPVETLFPATIGRPDPDGEITGDLGWTRVAVSQDTSCKSALSGAIAKEAQERGCVAALRATYLDGSGGTAATAAILAFRDEDDTRDLQQIVHDEQEKSDHAVRALAAQGLQWKDAARAGSGGREAIDIGLPYFVVVSAGPADGRRPGRLPEPWGRSAIPQKQDRAPWADTAKGVAEALAKRLADEGRKARA